MDHTKIGEVKVTISKAWDWRQENDHFFVLAKKPGDLIKK